MEKQTCMKCEHVHPLGPLELGYIAVWWCCFNRKRVSREKKACDDFRAYVPGGPYGTSK